MNKPWHHYANTEPLGASSWMSTGRVLLIERWILRNGQPAFEIRLPKGHVEPGETDQEAAAP